MCLENYHVEVGFAKFYNSQKKSEIRLQILIFSIENKQKIVFFNVHILLVCICYEMRKCLVSYKQLKHSRSALQATKNLNPL